MQCLVGVHVQNLQDARDVPKFRPSQVARNTHVRSATVLLGLVHVLARAAVARKRCDTAASCSPSCHLIGRFVASACVLKVRFFFVKFEFRACAGTCYKH